MDSPRPVQSISRRSQKGAAVLLLFAAPKLCARFSLPCERESRAHLFVSFDEVDRSFSLHDSGVLLCTIAQLCKIGILHRTYNLIEIQRFGRRPASSVFVYDSPRPLLFCNLFPCTMASSVV